MESGQSISNRSPTSKALKQKKSEKKCDPAKRCKQVGSAQKRARDFVFFDDCLAMTPIASSSERRLAGDPTQTPSHGSARKNARKIKNTQKKKIKKSERCKNKKLLAWPRRVEEARLCSVPAAPVLYDLMRSVWRGKSVPAALICSTARRAPVCDGQRRVRRPPPNKFRLEVGTHSGEAASAWVRAHAPASR